MAKIIAGSIDIPRVVSKIKREWRLQRLITTGRWYSWLSLHVYSKHVYGSRETPTDHYNDMDDICGLQYKAVRRLRGLRVYAVS